MKDQFILISLKDLLAARTGGEILPWPLHQVRVAGGLKFRLVSEQLPWVNTPLIRREQNGINHVDDAIGGRHVRNDDLGVVDHHFVAVHFN
jgi:hypothetical protein